MAMAWSSISFTTDFSIFFNATRTLLFISANTTSGSDKSVSLWRQSVTEATLPLPVSGEPEVLASSVRNSTDTETDPLTSGDTMRAVESAVLAGIVLPLVLCGIIFNICNMAVFLRQGLSDHINLCLFFLSMSDLLYMLFMLSWRSYAIAQVISESWGEFWKVRMMFMIGAYSATACLSNLMTMYIALERCVCIVWPLRAKAILTVRKVQLLILLAILVCAPCLILCFKFDVMTYLDPVTNITRYHATVTSFYVRNSNLIDNVYENINIIIPTVAFSIVIIATIVIAVRMRSALAWREDIANLGRPKSVTSARDRREASVTRMLTTICLIFTICMVPYVINAFARLVVHEYRPEGRYSNTLYVTTAFMHLFLCLNSSANFLVYVNMSSKFKATLRGMLGRRPTDDGKGHSELSTSRASKTTFTSTTSAVSTTPG